VPQFISSYWGNTPEGCETVLKQLHELYGKYKFMENKLIQQKRSLLTKIPEIESALDSLNYVYSKKDEDSVVTNLELADAVYVKAEITKCDTVMLWLGANVMVEYTYQEAHDLLSNNLANAKTTLETLNNHLSFLKDCITINEVNISRCHNHNVHLKAELKKAAAAGQQ